MLPVCYRLFLFLSFFLFLPLQTRFIALISPPQELDFIAWAAYAALQLISIAKLDLEAETQVLTAESQRSATVSRGIRYPLFGN